MEKDLSKKRKLQKESDKRGEKKQNPIPARKLFGPSSSNVKGIKTSKPKKGIKSLHSSDEEDEDCLCIYCLEPYANSKAKEKWVQCTKCKKWAHEDCTKGDVSFFVCVHCHSDNDDDFC